VCILLAAPARYSRLNNSIWEYGAREAGSSKHPDEYIAILLGSKTKGASGGIQTINDTERLIRSFGAVYCDPPDDKNSSTPSTIAPPKRNLLQSTAPVRDPPPGARGVNCEKRLDGKDPTDGLFIGERQRQRQRQPGPRLQAEPQRPACLQSSGWPGRRVR
jgi:hypothetical protein